MLPLYPGWPLRAPPMSRLVQGVRIATDLPAASNPQPRNRLLTQTGAWIAAFLSLRSKSQSTLNLSIPSPVVDFPRPDPIARTRISSARSTSTNSAYRPYISINNCWTSCALNPRSGLSVSIGTIGKARSKRPSSTSSWLMGTNPLPLDLALGDGEGGGH